MKKLLAVLLCLLFVLLVALPAVAAQTGSPEYPTIIVPGYSSSDLYLDGEQVWGRLKKDTVIDILLSRIAEFGRGLGELALKRPEYITDVLGEEILDYAGKLAMNPDGSSVYDVVTYDNDPAHTQFSYLYAKENGKHIHEPEIMKDIAKLYGAKGNESVFAYQQDFRKSQVDCAARLDKYIDDVLAFTGAAKVNIIAVSHGGQTVATYLSMYGREKNVINNLLLLVPAIGGVASAYDLLSETAALDEATLVSYLENSELLEEDVNWLVRANQFGILDDVVNDLMHRYAKQILGYWGSIWDFVPAENYDALKESLLDPAESADLIAKSDYFHHEVLANIADTFAACQAAGMKISIVAGAGIPGLTGAKEQSDMVVTTNSSTGAKCAPFGSRFGDGYQQIRTECADKTHNHLSPDMCVDASCGYLPENTWIVSGMYHGMMWKDPYCRALCKKLFLADEPTDVHTFAEYPQFHYSENPSFAVTATLDSSPQGYWSADDRALKVTNLSQKYDMQLISITVGGVDAAFDVKDSVKLAPGESYTVAMRGNIPKVSLTTADVTVNYALLSSKTPLGSRTLVFTLMNGSAPAYDADAPYADALHETEFEQIAPAGMARAFKRLGIYDLAKMIVNAVLTVVAMIKSMVGVK